MAVTTSRTSTTTSRTSTTTSPTGSTGPAGPAHPDGAAPAADDAAPAADHAARRRREALGPRFAHLLGATGASNLADGILLVGVPLLALTLTQSAQLIALVPAALTLPWLLLSIPVGLAVDRYDRVRMLALATAMRVGVLVGAAVAGVAGALSMPVLLALLFGLGAAEVVADSAAGTLIPATVRRDQLPTANSRLLGLQQLANSFLGGPVAGLVVALGAGWLFGVPAALCAAALLLVLRGLRGKVPHVHAAAGPRSVRAELAEGVAYLRQCRVVRSNIVAATVLNFANTGYFAVLVLWVVGPTSAVGLPAELYGLLAAVVAVGALLGTAVTARLVRRVSEARLLGTTWLVNGVLLAVPVLVPHVVALTVTALLLGFTSMVGNVVAASVRQRLIPDELRGRVGGVARMLAYGSMPLGAALGGLVGERLGLPAVFWGAAVICVVAVLWFVRAVPQREIDAADARADGDRLAREAAAGQVDGDPSVSG